MQLQMDEEGLPYVPDIWYYDAKWGAYNFPCGEPIRNVGEIEDVYLFCVRPLSTSALSRKDRISIELDAPAESVEGKSIFGLSCFHNSKSAYANIVPIEISELLNQAKDNYIRNMYLHFVEGKQGICTFSVEEHLLGELQHLTRIFHQQIMDSSMKMEALIK